MGCLLILAMVLVPLFPGISAETQKDRVLEQLMQSIELAKNEAMTGRQSMVICGSKDGLTCAQSPSWQHYWLVGVLAPGVGIPRVHKLHKQYTLPKDTTLKFKAFKGGRPEMLVIQPDGRTHNNGTFTYTYQDNGKVRTTTLIVNKVLRVYLKARTG